MLHISRNALKTGQTPTFSGPDVETQGILSPASRAYTAKARWCHAVFVIALCGDYGKTGTRYSQRLTTKKRIQWWLGCAFRCA